MKKFEPIFLQVALKYGDAAQSSTFSGTGTPPQTILRLAAGPVLLVKVTFLVSDVELGVEDFLFGLPILEHLVVDTKTLLEDKRNFVDGYDCSDIGREPTACKGVHISGLMTARLNQIIFNSNSTAVESNTVDFGIKKIHSRINPFSTFWTPHNTTK